MNRVRVIHMLCSDSYSGAENVVCQIVNMFKDDRRYEFVYASPDGSIREALEMRNVPFAPMKSATLREFKRVINEVKPTIIHAHDMKAGFLAALACGKIPMISHIHNNNVNSRKPTVKAALYRYAAVKAKHIFWVSQSSFDGYCFHDGLENKSTVLYNVIDPVQLKERADSAELKTAYDIIYIGRMTYQKNPQRLIKVLGEIIEEQPDIRCAMVGSGDLENEIRKEIHKRQLDKNIDFLGFQSNPYGILMRAKMMIMTSRWEGTPMCALEAMTLGVPIVSTPTDGLKELVKQCSTGFLEEDDIMIKKRCIEIVTNGTIREELSKAAMDRSKRLTDLDNYRRRMEKVYTRFL